MQVSLAKADASHITAAISSAVTTALGIQEEMWKKKLVGVASDGAAVMRGCRSGVVARITEGLLHVFAVHCMAHRLELSFKDAASKNPCCKKIDSLLMGLYYFYHNSALNRANLKASYESLQKPLLMPTHVGGTRWVSHILKALDHFLRGYAAVVQHLEQIQSPDSVGVCGEQKAKAKNFFSSATSMNVIKFSFFLFDVLFQLSKLSCVLQKKVLSVGTVHRRLESTKAVLEMYKTRAGPKLKEIEDKTTFEGTELTGSDVSFANSRSKRLSDLISSLDRRLGDASEGIVYATSIVDITTWPEKESSTVFGDDEIDCLVEHFTPVLQEASCDPSKISDE